MRCATRIGLVRTAGVAAGLMHGAAVRGQVIDIPPGSLPAESFFAANPGATVNVNSGGAIAPDAGDGDGVFTFNGATVNINSGGVSGFFSFDVFLEDVTYNVESGGEIVRTKFVGGAGSTAFNLKPGGVAERGLWLQGNTVGTITGGDIGVVAQGQAAMIVEDEASCTMSDGTIDTFVLIKDDAVFEQTGGTIDGAILVEDGAVVTVSGGSSGSNGGLIDEASVLNLTGGTVGSAFVAARGTVYMTGGGMGENSAILNGVGGVDPVFTMIGGALGSDFRAYDGTINVEGGLVGDRFRLGRPTGDGSGVTMNLVVKSATLAGTPLTLSTMPTTITARGGELLTCVLTDDSLISLNLNEGFVLNEDRVRSGAVLTVALDCPGDVNGDGTLGDSDFFAWVTAFTADPRSLAQVRECDVNRDGACSDSDFFAWVTAFTGAGCP